MLKRTLVVAVVLAAALYALLFIAGSGLLSDGPNAGTIEARAIDPAVVAERAERVRNAGEEIGYGIGWRVGLFADLLAEGSPMRGGALASLPIRYHGGSSVGGRAFLLLIPDERMVVALLVNYERFDGAALAGRVASAFLRR